MGKSNALIFLVIVLYSGTTYSEIISHKIHFSGHVSGSTSDLRFYGDQDTFWTLDSINNTVTSSIGSTAALQTSLFSVEDILDVTFINQSDFLWVATNSGDPYRINASGSVVSGNSDLRFYGDQDAFWTLDSANNTVTSSIGSTAALQTSLFSVEDILDVTFINQSDFLWVTVDDTPQSVPEAPLLSLIGSGLVALGFARRRGKDNKTKAGVC